MALPEQIYVDIDLHQNQLLNPTLQLVSIFPSDPKTSQICYLVADFGNYKGNLPYYYNGLDWIPLNFSLSLGLGTTGDVYSTVTSDSYNYLLNITVTGIQGKAITLANGYLKYNGSAFVFDNTTYGFGSVTSVGLTAPSIFTVTGSPITNSGVLSFSFNGSSNSFLLADGTTVLRSTYEPTLVLGTTSQYLRGDKTWQTLNTSVVPESATNLYYTDVRARGAISAISSISYNNATGVISHKNIDGYLHVPATGTTNNGKVLTAGATPGSLSWTTPTTGIVTSVGLTAPSIFTVSGSPVTTSGNLSFAFNNSADNIVLGDGTVKPLSEIGNVSGTNGQVAYFNGAHSVTSDTGFYTSQSGGHTNALGLGSSSSGGTLITLNAQATYNISIQGFIGGFLRSTINTELDGTVSIGQYNASGVLIDTPLTITNAVSGQIIMTRPVKITSLTSGLVRATAGLLSVDTTSYISLTGLSATSPILYNNTTGVFSHASTDGNLHVIATETTNNGKALTAGSTAGSLSWQTYILASQLGIAGGVATLDGSAKVPYSQLPAALAGAVHYVGTWNASTNTPALGAANANPGAYYIVSVAGTYLSVAYNVGDNVISDGTNWDKIDNNNAVTSVFGRMGAVVAALGDYSTYYLQLTGGTLSGNLLFGSDGLGVFFNAGTDGGIYKKVGTGLVIRQSSGNQTPQIENNAGTSLGSIWYGTAGGLLNNLNQLTNGPGYISLTGLSATSPILYNNSTGVISHASTDGNLHVPATGTTNNGKVLTADSTAGSLSWTTPTTGTVTSVGLTAPNIFTVSGSPVTTSGTLSFAFNGASTNFLLADGSTVATSTYLTTANTITLTGNVTGSGPSTNIVTSISSGTVTSKLLSGYTIQSAAALTTSDTLLVAFGKLEGSVNAKSPIASPTFTGTVTTPALTLSGVSTGTLINTSGVVSALSGTNLVLGNGTTLAQSTFQAANTNLSSIAALANASGALTNNGSGTFSYVAYLPLTSTITAAGPIGSAIVTPIITFNQYGQLTTVTSATITPAWESITSKPTTLAGYSITAADVTGQLLTGYVVGANTAIAATDSIIGAFGKIQAEINALGSNITGTNGQVALFNGTNSVNSNSAFTYTIDGTGRIQTLNLGSTTVGGPTSTRLNINQSSNAAGGGELYIGSAGGAGDENSGKIFLGNSGIRLIGRTTTTDRFKLQIRNAEDTAWDDMLSIQGTSGGTARVDIPTGLLSMGGTTVVSAARAGTLSALTIGTLSGMLKATSGVVSVASASDVTGQLLTGYVVGTNTAIAATDSILGAFGKIQAEINARPGTVTSVGITAPANMTASGTPVTSSGTLALAWNGSATNLVCADGSTVAQSTFVTGGPYVPIAGGTMTGALNGTSAAFGGDISGAYLKTSSLGTVLGLGAGALAGYNTYIGTFAGYSSSGTFNTFVGNSAGQANTTGNFGVYIGAYAGLHNTTGAANIYIGTSAGEVNVGAQNVFIGQRAGYRQTTASNLTIIDGYGDRGSAAAELTNSPIVATTTSSAATQTVTLNAAVSITGGGTGQSALHLNIQATPTTPADGDIWFTGDNLKIRIGGVTKTFPDLTIGTLSGTLIGTSGVISALSGTNLVLGDGTTIPQSTFTLASGGPYLPLAGGAMNSGAMITMTQTTSVYGVAGGIWGQVADSDWWGVRGGSTGADSGYLEIATGDGGSEPIYVRQYSGTYTSTSWGTKVRELVLFDSVGDTYIPGNTYVSGLLKVGNAQIGTYSTYATFGYGSLQNGNGYALLQNSSGDTVLNAASGRNVGICINNGSNLLTVSAYPQDSNTATAGIYMSTSVNTRIELASGSTDWQIDNNGSALRFYNPGAVRATIDTGGNVTAVGGLYGVTAKLNTQSAASTTYNLANVSAYWVFIDNNNVTINLPAGATTGCAFCFVNRTYFGATLATSAGGGITRYYGQNSTSYTLNSGFTWVVYDGNIWWSTY